MKKVISYPGDISPAERQRGGSSRTLWRCYRTRADRDRAATQLEKRGFSYLVTFEGKDGFCLAAAQ